MYGPFTRTRGYICVAHNPQNSGYDVADDHGYYSQVPPFWKISLFSLMKSLFDFLNCHSDHPDANNYIYVNKKREYYGADSE